jgi:hypothetical protein
LALAVAVNEMQPEASAGARRTAMSKDLLSAAEFFEVLRQVVAFREQPTIAHPLQHAVDQIATHPAFAQSRLLKRVLVALLRGGEFRRAEAATLDASTHALAVALMDLHRSGAVSDQEWVRAIEAAEAASA